MNYYTKFSFKVSGEQRHLQRLVDIIRDTAEETDFGLDCDLSLQARVLSIWTDESGDVDVLVQAIAYWQKLFKIDEPVGFEWINDADKPTDDAYGGGAVVIHKGKCKWLNTGAWLSNQMEKAGRKK